MFFISKYELTIINTPGARINNMFSKRSFIKLISFDKDKFFNAERLVLD